MTDRRTRSVHRPRDNMQILHVLTYIHYTITRLILYHMRPTTRKAISSIRTRVKHFRFHTTVFVAMVRSRNILLMQVKKVVAVVHRLGLY